MNENKTHEEKTAAESKSIGFDYQYYFFLWKLLKLEPGQSVGLEVKDDIHTDLNNNYQILYQLKHTVQKNSKGEPSNLTTLDLDMWKTFSNWSKLICDKNDSRSTTMSQLNFIRKTSFVLATNKSYNESNIIIKILNEFQNREKKIDDLIDEFQKLHDKTSDDKLKEYISDVLKLDIEVREQFLSKIFFELEINDLFLNCTEAIKAKMIPENKIDQAFKNIDSQLRKDNFLRIKDKDKLEITFEEFYKKYRGYFDIYNNKSLAVQEYNEALPNKLEDQIFIRQLIEIGLVEFDDIEYISRLTLFKLKLLRNLESWKQEGDITDIELKSFRNNAFTLWDNEFRTNHLGNVSDAENNDRGIKIFQTILRNLLKISGQELDADMSNGKFYALSDEPIIGWRKDWQKYKK